MEDFLVTVLPTPEDMGDIRGTYPQTYLYSPQFCCAQKIGFKHTIKIFPP